MRSQPFLKVLNDGYKFANAKAIFRLPGFRGGWEPWFQVEIASYMMLKNVFWELERERVYPNAPREICDFYLSRAQGADPTYIELKCMLPNAQAPIADIAGRFNLDIAKIQRHSCNQFSCFALAAVYGRFQPNPLNSEPIITLNNETLHLRQFAGATKSAFILTPNIRLTEIKQDSTTQQIDWDSELHIIAVADNRF